MEGAWSFQQLKLGDVGLGPNEPTPVFQADITVQPTQEEGEQELFFTTSSFVGMYGVRSKAGFFAGGAPSSDSSSTTLLVGAVSGNQALSIGFRLSSGGLFGSYFLSVGNKASLASLSGGSSQLHLTAEGFQGAESSTSSYRAVVTSMSTGSQEAYRLFPGETSVADLDEGSYLVECWQLGEGRPTRLRDKMIWVEAGARIDLDIAK